MNTLDRHHWAWSPVLVHHYLRWLQHWSNDMNNNFICQIEQAKVDVHFTLLSWSCLAGRGWLVIRGWGSLELGGTRSCLWFSCRLSWGWFWLRGRWLLSRGGSYAGLLWTVTNGTGDFEVSHKIQRDDVILKYLAMKDPSESEAATSSITRFFPLNTTVRFLLT